MANREKCDAPNALTVTMDDLILQLKAHGLPPTTTARIKLWICEGALHSAQDRSFAEYQSNSDNTMHKKDQFVDLIDHRKVFALFPDRDLARIAQAWSVALWQAKGSEDGAIETILRNGVLKNQLIPGASVGGRAKDVRIEFFYGGFVG